MRAKLYEKRHENEEEQHQKGNDRSSRNRK